MVRQHVMHCARKFDKPLSVAACRVAFTIGESMVVGVADDRPLRGKKINRCY